MRGATARWVAPGGQRFGAAAPAIASTDYGFLLGRLVDRATLARAEALAGQWGVRPHDVMIALGWITAEDYARALADDYDLAFAPTLAPNDIEPVDAKSTARDCLASSLLKWHPGGFVYAPDRLWPHELSGLIRRLTPSTLTLAPPDAVKRVILDRYAASLCGEAIDGLNRRYPDQSARTDLPGWQRYGFAAAAVLFLLVALFAPVEAIRGLTYCLALLFVPIIGVRLAALFCLGRADAAPPSPRIPDAELPVYTVMVALFREANVLPQLTAALTKLDYPAAKLDIKLVLEAADQETIAAARGLNLPGNVEIVVVPDLEPRTKPKALNYALPLARGDYLVVYDAEDRPERDQLRKALAAFRAGPPSLACLQARLTPYNARENWLTRQFTIEYCALFDGLLPTLARFDLPFPLGGTSNHFRIAALKWLMAWDPFNVTEDADLGARLARNGYGCRVLDSSTYEEAPCRLPVWLRQRTRWIKGYLQTWLVHMRNPARLYRELGPSGFAAFQVVVGGTLLSALVHPWFYVLLGFDIASGAFASRPQGLIGMPFWIAAWLDLATGYLAAMGVGLLAVRKRGLRFLFWQIPLMPVYWLLISAAAYRACWQFIGSDRFTWEKTEHGISSIETAPAARAQDGIVIALRANAGRRKA